MESDESPLEPTYFLTRKGSDSFGGFLEHLRAWAERQELEMRFEGLQACTKFSVVWHSPTVTCMLALQPEILLGIFPVMTVNAPDSQKWHKSLNRKWMRSRNVGAARATLTREDSEWSWKFGEPWQARPHDWRGVGQVFLQGCVKGLAKSL